MTIADQYARALSSLVEEHPEQSAAYLANLKQVLRQRGHERLLPSVLRAYESLQLAHQRSLTHQQTNPERERTRALLQLYIKLIAS